MQRPPHSVCCPAEYPLERDQTPSPSSIRRLCRRGTVTAPCAAAPTPGRCAATAATSEKEKERQGVSSSVSLIPAVLSRGQRGKKATNEAVAIARKTGRPPGRIPIRCRRRWVKPVNLPPQQKRRATEPALDEVNIDRKLRGQQTSEQANISRQYISVGDAPNRPDSRQV